VYKIDLYDDYEYDLTHWEVYGSWKKYLFQ
jgi:hypothetical protein